MKKSFPMNSSVSEGNEIILRWRQCARCDSLQTIVSYKGDDFHTNHRSLQSFINFSSMNGLMVHIMLSSMSRQRWDLLSSLLIVVWSHSRQIMWCDYFRWDFCRRRDIPSKEHIYLAIQSRKDWSWWYIRYSQSCKTRVLYGLYDSIERWSW
jgi:hypothetical protein